MRSPITTLALAIAAMSLAGCATAPRTDAGLIADAGIKATGTLQSDVNTLAAHVTSADVTEAFTQRWQICAVPANCGVSVPIDQHLFDERRKLAEVIHLRAKALGALGQAYGALKQEADYDARADATSATNDAVSAVNDFAGNVFALAKAPIPAPVVALAGDVAGIIADSRQRHRILAANAKLREIAQRLHDGLKQEAFVFDTVAASTERQRSAAKIALFRAGLIPGTTLLQPMVNALGVTLNPGADGMIANSPALRAATIDTARAQSAAETVAIQGRYQASLAALDALIAEQDQLGGKGGVSLAEVDRLLGTIVASLQAGKGGN
jgi:hypothetical protein